MSLVLAIMLLWWRGNKIMFRGDTNHGKKGLLYISPSLCLHEPKQIKTQL